MAELKNKYITSYKFDAKTMADEIPEEFEAAAKLVAKMNEGEWSTFKSVVDRVFEDMVSNFKSDLEIGDHEPIVNLIKSDYMFDTRRRKKINSD